MQKYIQPQKYIRQYYAIVFVLLVLCMAETVCPNTYELKKIFPVSPEDYYFYDASAVAVDYQNFIYIADKKNNRVVKYTNDGRFVKQWGGFDRITDICYDGKHSLFTVDLKTKNQIQQYSLDGELIHSWGSFGSSLKKLLNPQSITIDHNGYVYVVDTKGNKVNQYKSDGSFKSSWNYNEELNEPVGNEELNEPVGIALCHQSNLCFYVLERSSSKTGPGRMLQVMADESLIDCKVTDLQIEITSNSNNYSNDYEAHIATDSDGNIYFPHETVIQYNPDQNSALYWDYNLFQKPVGITVAKNEIYVTDWDKNCVQKFSKQGELLNLWGYYGNEPGQLKNPYGLAYHDQWIYVADTGNNRIQVFDMDGNWNKILEQDIDKPTDIVCHSDGTLYISDQNNKRIISIESNGYTFIYELNRYPDRIDIDGTGNLYISSYDFEESKRKVYTIQKLNTRTKEIVFTCALPNDYTLDTLQDIAVTQEGYTILAIFQGRESILQFNEKGSFSGEWEPDAGNNSFAAITVDLSNNIYVELTNKINKYSSNKKIVTFFEPQQLNQDKLRKDTRRGLCTSDDSIFLTDDYSRIQIFRPQSQSFNKAIIIAGSANNTFRDLIQLQANLVYQTLIQQQWKKENIKYLSSYSHRDLYHDDKADDYAKAGRSNLKTAITDWANNSELLLIYMIGSGGKDKFRLSDESLPYTCNNIPLQDENIVYSYELNEWLDELQSTSDNVKIVIICDTDYSGAFIADLQSSNRILISSTSKNNTAIFPDKASLSFSSIFWRAVSHNKNIKDAFLDAATISSDLMGKQLALIDSNANDIFCENEDLCIAANYQFHQSNDSNLQDSYTNNIPTIDDNVQYEISYNPSILKITANQISADKRIDRVFGVMLPLNSQKQATDYPIIEFKPGSGTVYKRKYTGACALTHSGEYRIVMYARDTMFALSEPHILTVSVSIPRKKKAVIIVGNATTDNIQSCYKKNADFVYDALKYQGYSDDDIAFFDNSDIAPDNDHQSIYDNIQDYFETFNTDSAKEIIIYLIGEGDYQSFHLGENLVIKAIELNQWINFSSIDLTLIYDAGMGESFIRELNLNNNQSNRILIASSQLFEPSYCLLYENVSFSRIFWSQVRYGLSTKQAFDYASHILNQLNIDQTPQILDQNHMSPFHYIGSGLKYFSDEPVIGTASATLEDDNDILLEVNHLSSTNDINKVWAVIIPADKHPLNSNALQTSCPIPSLMIKEALLNKSIGSKYNKTIEFTNSGEYLIHIFSRNNDGVFAKGHVIPVCLNKGKDLYEPDNEAQTAHYIIINDQQQHSFHEKSDVDVLTFYGRGGNTYKIIVNRIDPPEIFDFYWRIYGINVDTGDIQYSMDKEWYCDTSGTYYISLQNLTNLTSFEPFGYQISIAEQNATFPNHFKGRVYNQLTNELIPNVLIQTDFCETKSYDANVDSLNIDFWCDTNSLEQTKFKFSCKSYKNTETLFDTKGMNHYIDQPLLPITKNIKVFINGNCGSITPGTQDVLYGESITYTFKNDDCCLIDYIKIDNRMISPLLEYEFKNITENHTIKVKFISHKYYSPENLISIIKTIAGTTEKPICQSSEILSLSEVVKVLQYLTDYQRLNNND